MKPKSAAGILCIVKNLNSTVEFYKKLGLDFKKLTPDHATGYLNWYWLEFVPLEKAEPTLYKKLASEDDKQRGSGIFMHFSTENVDDFYEFVIKQGLKPSSEPKTFAWGRREFVLRDPDGYKLVFFQKM